MKSNRNYVDTNNSRHNPNREMTAEECRALEKEDKRIARNEANKMVEADGFVNLYRVLGLVVKAYNRRLYNQVAFEVAFAKAIAPMESDQQMEMVISKKNEVQNIFKAYLADEMNFARPTVTTNGFTESMTLQFCHAFG